VIDRHIFPQWHGKNINEITTQNMEGYVSGLLRNGKSDGVELTRKTVLDIFILIKSIFKYALKQSQIICDFTQISIPKSEKHIRILTKQEQRQLEEILLTDSDRFSLGVLLCLYTGIQIGELCAVKGDHLSIKDGILSVNSTMQRVKNLSGFGAKTKITITSPKSRNSDRSIPIPKFLIPLLLKFETQPDAYFLTGLPDKFIEPRTVQNRFYSYIKSAGIKNANFHATRHTFATNAVEQGFDIKSLSEILGHANVNTTLQLYVHPSFELKRKYMDRLSRIAYLPS
jgi:integrase